MPFKIGGGSAAGGATGGQKSGTGTTEFTNQAFHENRYWNIKTDFGVLGDGTPEGSKILAALEAVSNSSVRTILFPKGVYLNETLLQFTDKTDLEIVGEPGATLKAPNAANTTLAAAVTTTTATTITVASAAGFPTTGTYIVRIDSEYMVVTGGHGTTTWTVLRGQHNSTAATHASGAAVHLGAIHMLRFTNCDRVNVRGMTLDGGFSTIAIGNPFGQYGMLFEKESTECSVIDCNFKNINDTAVTDKTMGSTSAGITDTKKSHFIMRGCRFNNVKTVFNTNGASRYVIVTDNHAYNCKYGFKLNGEDFGADWATFSGSFVVADNSFHDMGGSDVGLGSGGCIILETNLRDADIHDNIMTNLTKVDGVIVSQGVESLDTKSIRIHHNKVDGLSGGAAAYSVRNQSSTTAATLEDITLEANDATNISASYGYYVAVSNLANVIRNVSIRGGELRDFTAGSIGLRVIADAASGTPGTIRDLLVEGNYFANFEDQMIRVTGSANNKLEDVTIRGNRFTDWGTLGATEADATEGVQLDLSTLTYKNIAVEDNHWIRNNATYYATKPALKITSPTGVQSRTLVRNNRYIGRAYTDAGFQIDQGYTLIEGNHLRLGNVALSGGNHQYLSNTAYGSRLLLDVLSAVVANVTAEGNRFEKAAADTYGVQVSGASVFTETGVGNIYDSGFASQVNMVAGTRAVQFAQARDYTHHLTKRSSALAEAFSRNYISSVNLTMTSGRLRLSAIPLPSGISVVNLHVAMGATAMITPTNSWFALYNGPNANAAGAAYALLGVTADQLTAVYGTSDSKILALTTPYVVPETALYYIGIVVVAATMPTLSGISSSVNFLGAAPSLAIDANTGLTTPATAPAVASGFTNNGGRNHVHVS